MHNGVLPAAHIGRGVCARPRQQLPRRTLVEGSRDDSEGPLVPGQAQPGVGGRLRSGEREGLSPGHLSVHAQIPAQPPPPETGALDLDQLLLVQVAQRHLPTVAAVAPVHQYFYKPQTRLQQRPLSETIGSRNRRAASNNREP